MIHVIDFMADWEKKKWDVRLCRHHFLSESRPGRRFHLFYVSHNIQILVLTVSRRVNQKVFRELYPRCGTGSSLSSDRKKWNRDTQIKKKKKRKAGWMTTKDNLFLWRPRNKKLNPPNESRNRNPVKCVCVSECVVVKWNSELRVTAVSLSAGIISVPLRIGWKHREGPPGGQLLYSSIGFRKGHLCLGQSSLSQEMLF